MKKAIWILWPGFIVAGVAEVLFFTVVDPVEIHLFGQPAGVSRLAAYTLGFLFFWAFAASSSAFTCFLQRRAEEINRCPFPPGERPAVCPGRQDADACR